MIRVGRTWVGVNTGFARTAWSPLCVLASAAAFPPVAGYERVTSAR